MKKKLFSILICLAMSAGLSPIVALADDGQEAAIGGTTYETLQEAIDNAKDGETITVLKDIVLTRDTTLKIAPETRKSITIDLNQKKISYPNDGEWTTATISVDKPVALNITNGQIDAGDDDHTAIRVTCAEDQSPVDLTISNVKIGAGYAGIYTDLYGVSGAGKNKITLNNVDIISSQYGINAERADLIFESGSIHTTGDETFYVNDCNLTINAGKFISTDDTCVQASVSEIGINGGEFESGDDYALDLYKSKALLDGGIFKGPDNAFSADQSDVVLGEHAKAIYSDGTALDDFMNSTHVEVIKTVVKVTFVDDGKHVAEVLVRRGKSISSDDIADESMPADPHKQGYSFKEWRTAENGSGDVFTDTSVVNKDLTVYANYEKNKGSIENTDSINSGSITEVDSPKTGDDNGFYMWSALLIVSASAVIAITVKKRRKKNIR